MNRFLILLIIYPTLLQAGLLVENSLDATSAPEPLSLPRQEQSANKRLFDPQAIKNSKRIWLDVEALLWQSSEDGLNFALRSDSQTQVSNGHVNSPDFDWDWGVRLGLGIKLPYDDWDLLFTYTHIHAHADKSVHAPTDGAVFPSLMAPFGLPDSFFANSAHCRWDANLNIGDIELGRNCLVGHWLSIRPFMGMRGLGIDQDIHVDYKGGTAVPDGDEDQVRNRNDFWGLGLRMGADTLWGLGAGFGIYGNGAASLLAGDFTVREKEELKDADVRKIILNADTDSVVAIAELALGIQWDHLFSKDRYHFGVKFGWEFNVFFDQNRQIRFIDADNPAGFTRSNGDLAFQGLTFGFRFDF